VLDSDAAVVLPPLLIPDTEDARCPFQNSILCVHLRRTLCT
jgi:hypothetical protein